MKQCPTCSAQLAGNAQTCPKCGYNFAGRGDANLLARILIWVLLLGVGSCVALAFAQWWANR